MTLTEQCNHLSHEETHNAGLCGLSWLALFFFLRESHTKVLTDQSAPITKARFQKENDRPRCIRRGNGPLVLAQGRSRWAFLPATYKEEGEWTSKRPLNGYDGAWCASGEEVIIHRSHCNTSWRAAQWRLFNIERLSRRGTDENARERALSKILPLFQRYGLNQFNDLLPVGLLAQLVTALHRYRRGRGFESRTRLNFFRAFFSQLQKMRL